MSDAESPDPPPPDRLVPLGLGGLVVILAVASTCGGAALVVVGLLTR